jgi:hypothetical protein
MARTTTYELAELLAKLEETLRSGPDLPVVDLLSALGAAPPRAARRVRAPTEPLPPLDPATLSREELAVALSDKKRFRTKKLLVEFARQHGVAVAEKDKAVTIIGQILQVLHDIPRERSTLRSLDLQ